MTARSSSARFRSSRQRPGPSFREALERMRDGGVLRLTYIRGLPVWELNDRPVSPEIVSLLTSGNTVEPDGDGLFADQPCQSWRIRR